MGVGRSGVGRGFETNRTAGEEPPPRSSPWVHGEEEKAVGRKIGHAPSGASPDVAAGCPGRPAQPAEVSSTNVGCAASGVGLPSHADGVRPGIERRLGQSPPFAERADGLPATAELPQGVVHRTSLWTELRCGPLPVEEVMRRHAGISDDPGGNFEDAVRRTLTEFSLLASDHHSFPGFLRNYSHSGDR